MKEKFERWYPFWKANSSEIRMSKLLNKMLTQIEKLPEKEQQCFLCILHHHVESLLNDLSTDEIT